MNDASANTAALYEQVRALRAEVRALRVAVGNPRGPGPRPRRRKQVLQLIRRRGPMTVPELSRSLGTTYSYALRVVTRLRSEGVLVPDGVRDIDGTFGIRPTIYRIGG